MSTFMEEFVLFQEALSEYTTLGPIWPVDGILADLGQQASLMVPSQEVVVVGQEQVPIEVPSPSVSESNPAFLSAAMLELGPFEDPAFDIVASSDPLPTSSTHKISPGNPFGPIAGPSAGTTFVSPVPQGATTSSTSPCSAADISRMRNKAMIVELKKDYLVPSWAVEGKRIQSQMLRDPVLVQRKLENKKFVEGHDPMSRNNLIRLLEQCRKVPKWDMSIDTLHEILKRLDLFTVEQWELFERERKAKRIPRRRRG